MKLIEENIYNIIVSDLNPPLSVVIIKTSLAFTLSCLFSFIFCGQFGFTPTTLSHDVHLFLINSQGELFLFNCLWDGVLLLWCLLLF